jgi:hypothetical protein
MKKINSISAVLILAILIISCGSKKGSVPANISLPYPNENGARWIQAQVDSSRYLWFLDPAATVSAFCNEYSIFDQSVSTVNVTVKDVGIFHALTEVQIGDRKLEVTLDRPFKELGEKSIWQVVKYGEKK